MKRVYFFAICVMAMLLGSTNAWGMNDTVPAINVTTVRFADLDSATRAIFVKEANARRYGSTVRPDVSEIVAVYEITGIRSRATGPSTQYLTIYRDSAGNTCAAVTRVNPITTAQKKSTTVVDLFKAGYHQGDDPDYDHTHSASDTSNELGADW